MSTNLQIIEGALRDINVISEIDPASAEQGAHGLRKLNQMMEAWRDQSIDFGWFAQTSTADASPIPDYAELAVTAGLSVVLAPRYGATISQELAVVADNAISSLRRKMISESLDNTDMSHLPIGQGHRWRYDITSG